MDASPIFTVRYDNPHHLRQLSSRLLPLMRRILPRPSVASPLPIWPLLQECRAQRRWYSAASASHSHKADEQDDAEKVVSGNEASFSTRTPILFPNSRTVRIVDDGADLHMRQGASSSPAPAAAAPDLRSPLQSSRADEFTRLKVPQIRRDSQVAFLAYLHQLKAPSFLRSSFLGSRRPHDVGFIVLLYRYRDDAIKTVRLLDGQIFNGNMLHVELQELPNSGRNSVSGDIPSQLSHSGQASLVGMADTSKKPQARKPPAPISGAFRGKLTQPIVSAGQETLPTNAATSTTQRSSQPTVSAGLENLPTNNATPTTQKSSGPIVSAGQETLPTNDATPTILKPSQPAASARQKTLPTNDTTPTTQKTPRQSLVTPGESESLLESLKALNKITDQLLRVMTEQNSARGTNETMSNSAKPNVAKQPLQTSRAPTWEDRLRQRSIPTPLEQIGDPNPDGQLAKAMEDFVNMNQDRGEKDKLGKNKLRRWSRYSEVAAGDVKVKSRNTVPVDKTTPSTDKNVEDEMSSKVVESETVADQEPTAAPVNVRSTTNLFAQLFPESSATEQLPPEPPSLGNPENLMVPTVKAVRDQPAQIGRREDGTALPPETVGKLSASESIDNPRTTVLIIRGLSANLAEDDIRRLVPKSKHLKGWHMGDSIFRVIAQRDTRTLIRTGAYYIIFRHSSAAHEYRRALRRMQSLSSQYTPSSIISPVMPTKQANVFQGTLDVAAAIRNFTLCVPGQPLDIREVRKPWLAAELALFKRGGYPQVKDTADESIGGVTKTAQVLVSFEYGFVPTRNDIEAAIRWDGARRHMGWRIDWPEEFSARVKHDQRSAVLDTNEGPIRRLDPRDTPVQIDEEIDVMLPEESATSLGDEERDETLVTKSEQLRGEPLPDDIKYADKVMRSRWLISFKDETEARRFAIAWHMRPLPVNQGFFDATGLSEDEVPICKAEVIW